MKKLTEQEEAVMLHIWKLKECVVKDILNNMEEPRPPYTTLASIVRNLESKHYVQAKKYGNVYVYSPLISDEDYKKMFMSSVIKSYFKNSYKELVSFFAQEQEISTEELEDIIKMIEKGKNK